MCPVTLVPSAFRMEVFNFREFCINFKFKMTGKVWKERIMLCLFYLRKRRIKKTHGQECRCSFGICRKERKEEYFLWRHYMKHGHFRRNYRIYFRNWFMTWEEPKRVQKFRTAHNIIHFGQNLPHCMRPHYVQFYGCRGYLQVQRRKVRSADSSVRAIQQIIIVWNVKMARAIMLWFITGEMESLKAVYKKRIRCRFYHPYRRNRI